MPRDVRRPLSASVTCALLVVALAVVAYKFGPAVRLDTSLVHRVGLEDNQAGYGLADLVTSLVNPLPFLAFLAAIVTYGLVAGRIPETIAALVIVAGSDLSTQVLKHLLEHDRYQPVLGSFQPSSQAFPSGHTTAAASLAMALVLIAPPRVRPLAAAFGAALTVAVGIGLVVIKAHYPSDVLGGILVVASWTFAAIAALRLVRPRGPEADGKGARPAGRFAISLQ